MLLSKFTADKVQAASLTQEMLSFFTMCYEDDFSFYHVLRGRRVVVLSLRKSSFLSLESWKHQTKTPCAMQCMHALFHFPVSVHVSSPCAGPTSVSKTHPTAKE